MALLKQQGMEATPENVQRMMAALTQRQNIDARAKQYGGLSADTPKRGFGNFIANDVLGPPPLTEHQRNQRNLGRVFNVAPMVAGLAPGVARGMSMMTPVLRQRPPVQPEPFPHEFGAWTAEPTRMGSTLQPPPSLNPSELPVSGSARIPSDELQKLSASQVYERMGLKPRTLVEPIRTLNERPR